MRRYSYRLDVKKLNEAGFLSHRDLILLVKRVLIRSELPVHTSGGHKWPSPKISVLHPLPIGVESVREMITFKLLSFSYPSKIRKRMSPIPFPGLDLLNIVPLSGRSQPSIREMTFRIEFDQPLPDGTSFTFQRNGENEEPSGEHPSVPDNLLQLEVDGNACTYQTASEQGILHPDAVLQWMKEQSDESVPPVRRIVKTDMIIEE